MRCILAIGGFALCFAMVFAVLSPPLAIAQPSNTATSQATSPPTRSTIRGSGQPIPRFMSLKADRVNMRAGPGLRYPIQFVYRQSGYPLKIIGEFDAWREVIDHAGDKGWMHASVLSAARLAWVLDDGARIYRSGATTSPPIAEAEAGAVVELLACGRAWCRVAAGRTRGWMQKAQLWGVLSGEEF